MSQFDELIEVDELALYFGDPYRINDYITVSQPTIGQIIEYGEREYYGMVQTITAIPSEMKANLWDGGLDWTQLKDFDLFMMMSRNLSVDKTKILLGDLDLSKMVPVENRQNGEIVLRDAETGAIIDELAYKRMTAYLCKMHNLTKKVEKAANEFTKKFMIEEDRQKIEYQKKQPYKSFLLPLISSVKARQGYTRDYVRNMVLTEFFDEVTRLQIIVQTDALLIGAHSGMVDTKKIPQKSFNWMRDTSEK